MAGSLHPEIPLGEIAESVEYQQLVYQQLLQESNCERRSDN